MLRILKLTYFSQNQTFLPKNTIQSCFKAKTYRTDAQTCKVSYIGLVREKHTCCLLMFNENDR